MKMTGTSSSSLLYLRTEPARTTQLNWRRFQYLMFFDAPVPPVEMEIKSMPSNDGEKPEDAAPDFKESLKLD